MHIRGIDAHAFSGRGSRMVKTVRPGLLSNSMSPPWRVTRSCETARPSPCRCARPVTSGIENAVGEFGRHARPVVLDLHARHEPVPRRADVDVRQRRACGITMRPRSPTRLQRVARDVEQCLDDLVRDRAPRSAGSDRSRARRARRARASLRSRRYTCSHSSCTLISAFCGARAGPDIESTSAVRRSASLMMTPVYSRRSLRAARARAAARRRAGRRADS